MGWVHRQSGTLKDKLGHCGEMKTKQNSPVLVRKGRVRSGQGGTERCFVERPRVTAFPTTQDTWTENRKGCMTVHVGLFSSRPRVYVKVGWPRY